MNLKICVLNFSGNVGKTTVAAHLLQPRLDAARIFSVESLNLDAEGDGVEVLRLRGKRFADLQREMLLGDSAVVDVGASNAEDFITLMQQYVGSHEDYDVFLVPSVSQRKQQTDTINTLQSLAALGVPNHRIKLVFNRLDPQETVDDAFAGLLGFAETQGLQVDRAAVIYTNEVFDKLKGSGWSLADVLADPADYRALLRQASTEQERERCVERIAVKRLASSCAKNLDDVFAALFGR